jgi:hypothetical protein
MGADPIMLKHTSRDWFKIDSNGVEAGSPKSDGQTSDSCEEVENHELTCGKVAMEWKPDLLRAIYRGHSSCLQRALLAQAGPAPGVCVVSNVDSRTRSVEPERLGGHDISIQKISDNSGN